MKFLIFIFLLLPCSLFGQLKGEYMFWGGEFSTTFVFEKNGRFHYDYTNDTNGESGRGTYKIEKDTLIFTYEAYLDSGEFDCGRIVVEKESLREIEDSIQIVISARDCQTNDTIFFPQGSIHDGNTGELIISNHGGLTGVCTLSVSASHKSLNIFINSPEYIAQQLQLDSVSANSLRIKAFLMNSYRTVIEKGFVEKCLIVEKRRKYIKLKRMDHYKGTAAVYLKNRKKWRKWSDRKLMEWIMEFYRKSGESVGMGTG